MHIKKPVILSFRTCVSISFCFYTTLVPEIGFILHADIYYIIIVRALHRSCRVQMHYNWFKLEHKIMNNEPIPMYERYLDWPLLHSE
jgi:hypothetical protein